MQKNIKYISFYKSNSSERNYSLAATNKIDYIANTLTFIGFKVLIVSPSWIVTTQKNKPIDLGKTTTIGNNIDLKTFTSWDHSFKISLYFKIIFSLFSLFFYLIFNAKKNEKVIVYHSQWIALPIILAKKIKKFHLILEIEEIYADVSSINKYFDKLETKIIKLADSYLFSNDLLAKKINDNKKHTVIYGNYTVYPKIASPIKDGKIHLLYAGIIDSEKLGAFNAIETAMYLNDNYVMHIIGSGEVDKLTKRIGEINSVSKCKIVFDGQLSGDDYIEYCQKCHIGLSTQKIEGGFVDSSFPSKILSYLGMGLQVVSGYVSVVANSKIANNVSFYKTDTPEHIAQTILNVSFCNSSFEKMNELDNNFKQQLKNILNN